MSAKAIVQPRPYTAESASVTPRTTAEERTKWRFIAQRDYYICREVEPEDSWRNRVFWRTLGTEGRQQAGQDTREEIRSQPDYDGPPMKPPSGPVFEFFDVTGTPSQEFSAITNTSSVWLREQITDEQARGHAELLQHFSAMARRGECKYKHPEPIDADPEDAYVSPSSGGRGWCPKLAGVQT